MSDIHYLLKLIRSDNYNDRYEACEQLRVWPESLPPEAINALNLATHDSNADVADAARRALAFHTRVNSGKAQNETIISIADGFIKQQADTGIINISHPRREILLALIAYAASSVGLAILGFILMITDARFLFLLLVAAYLAYSAYRKFLGTQKNAIEINPQMKTIRIEAKKHRQVLFTDIKTVSAQPGEGIVLAGMAMIDIVLTLKSGERIIIASLSEDAVSVANKVEEIGDMVANAIGLKSEKEAENSL